MCRLLMLELVNHEVELQKRRDVGYNSTGNLQRTQSSLAKILFSSHTSPHLGEFIMSAHQKHEAAINCEEAKDGVAALVMEELLPE